jgi:hypothetical protein
MTTKLVTNDEDEAGERLSRQALAFFLHAAVALAAWIGFMLLGYAIQPSISQTTILLLSILVPGLAGFFFTRVKPDAMAGHVWLAGLIWVMLMSLWILDMPTGPNECNQCSAGEKLTRTLFSIPRPSGLIDDNGPFLCTWPASALIGYALGARLSMRRRGA